MSDSPFVINVTEENFQSVVIEGSQQHPVLVDFWADWCNPCQVLIPIVTKLAEEYGGKFILAKINSDDQQQLAAANGVRSLPTVKLFKNGEAVDEFMGALPESDVRAFLDKHIEQQMSESYIQAMQLYSAGDIESAIPLFNQALTEDPNNATLKTDLATILAQQGDFDSARSLINSMSDEQKDEAKVKELLAQMNLQERLNDAPSIDELLQKIAADEFDLESRLQLSDVYAASGKTEEALQQLLFIMQKDRSFKDDAGRIGLINLFDMLGADHPLSKTYRRKMFSLMH